MVRAIPLNRLAGLSKSKRWHFHTAEMDAPTTSIATRVRIKRRGSSHAPEDDRHYYSKDAANGDALAELMMRSLLASERKLRRKGVPEKFWWYVAANSVPPARGSPNYDGDMGAIVLRRDALVNVIIARFKGGPGSRSAMAAAAIDCRDLRTLHRYVGRTLNRKQRVELMNTCERVTGAPVYHGLAEWFLNAAPDRRL